MFGKHLAFASRLGRKACVHLHAYLGMGREEGGESLLFRGRYGDDEYNCCMTRTSLHFLFVLPVACLHGGKVEQCKGSNRFDLLSKPSRETRSPKNSDPGVKHDICKVIGSFASIGVQSALSAIKTTKHHMMSFGQSQAWNHSTSSKADLGNFNGNQTSRFRKRTRAKEFQE